MWYQSRRPVIFTFPNFYGGLDGFIFLIANSHNAAFLLFALREELVGGGLLQWPSCDLLLAANHTQLLFHLVVKIYITLVHDPGVAEFRLAVPPQKILFLGEVYRAVCGPEPCSLRILVDVASSDSNSVLMSSSCSKASCVGRRPVRSIFFTKVSILKSVSMGRLPLCPLYISMIVPVEYLEMFI